MANLAAFFLYVCLFSIGLYRAEKLISNTELNLFSVCCNFLQLYVKLIMPLIVLKQCG